MKLNENKLKKLLKEYLFEIYSGSYSDESYKDGHIDDMMLDKEGWITDPDDRKKIKKWYLDMKLSHK